MSLETIETHMDGHVGVITLNRPTVLNAINTKMIEEINGVMAQFAEDPEVRAIVLQANGRAFSAGFDLKESVAEGPSNIDDWRQEQERNFNFIMQFWEHPKPTVAAVHGFCLAGAFELALACDVTVAAEDSLFGEPEVRFGVGIVSLILPWSVGPKKAKEWILTGNDHIPADEALRCGAINHVVEMEELHDRAMSLAKDMSAAAARAVQNSKLAINRTYDIMGMREALLTARDIDLLITVAGGPENEEFNQIRRDKGLKAALAWRDAKFR